MNTLEDATMPRSAHRHRARPEPDADRVAELEAELRQRDDKIRELTKEVTDLQEVVNEQREWGEDQSAMIESWKDVFEMREREDGKLEWGRAQRELLDRHIELIDIHNRLVRQYNRLIRERWPREIGRPLAASEAQVAEVLKRRKAGSSLRAIAAQTSLGLSTVRSIIKGGKRKRDLHRKEFDRLRAARYRGRKKARDRLPGQVAELQKTGAALVKAAKGIGR